MTINLLKTHKLPVIFFTAFLYSFTVSAQCTSAGPLSPATAASVSYGGSDFGFSNAGNVFSSDNNRASAAGLLSLFTGETEYLQATNFGFNIPSTAIICGIVVEVEKSATGIGTVVGIGLSYVTDYSVRLVRNGTVVGNDKATGANWTTSEGYYTYGGANDIWGVAWTPADINASNFGIAFSASINGLAMLIPNVRIDHIRITVYYTVTLLADHFLSFQATATNNSSAMVEWKTPVESSARTYTVQRSRDGAQWETVSGQINKTYQAGKTVYSLEDKQPYSGASFYRVLSQAMSGEIVYSPVKAIQMENNNQLKAYPNPFTDRLTISGIDRTATVSLTDPNGRKIPLSHSTKGTLHLSHLKPGLYFLHTKNKTLKIQKL